MKKRGKLDIMRDILSIIQQNHNSIKITPLIRKSNISSKRFKEYYLELIEKNFIRENTLKEGRIVSLTEKGKRFLERYKTIISFIKEFGL